MDTRQLMDTAIKFIHADLAIAPCLLQDRMHRINATEPPVIELIKDDASVFAKVYLKTTPPSIGQTLLSERFLEDSYYVTACSTAIYLSYLRLGALSVREEMFLVAKRILEDFIERVGAVQFVQLYRSQATFENLNTINYYKNVSTPSFLTGELHCPWGATTLRDELKLLIQQGLVVKTMQDELILTPKGQQMHQELTEVLKQSGYLNWRSRLIRLEKFNQMSDIEDILKILTPGSAEQRKLLIEQNELESRCVLELGCGSGALTFDAGLYRAVGNRGHLIASDPSINMLTIAKQKQENIGANWVEIVHAQAEDIPFPDNSFDCVVGCWFLHWTNIPQAIKEIARVLKPGGVFSSVHALNYPATHEFFNEWFEPLLSPTDQLKNKADSLPTHEDVPREMEQYFQNVLVEHFDFPTYYTSPETVVHFHVDIANTFQEQMESFPWRARKNMIEELIYRGNHIINKYPPEQLVEQHPAQFIKAVKM